MLRATTLLVSLAMLLTWGPAASAQPAAPAGPPAAEAPPASESLSLRPGLRPRPLAPGVLTTISPEREPEETFSGPLEMVEIVQGMPDLAWTPTYFPKSQTLHEMARQVVLRRKIWCLEFSFKPVRTIYVDVPQPNGAMQRKLIWYMVYRVKNTGYHLNPTPTADSFGHTLYTPAEEQFSVRFFPTFVLESHKLQKAYLDRVIPVAVEKIQEAEDPAIRLFNSVQISQVDIPVSTERIDRSVWGVAIWEDIDPRTDLFSIYVQGLTNAHRFEDPPGAFQPGDPPGTGRRFAHKTLQLNFHRPGDEFLEQEHVIRLGIRPEIAERYGLDPVDYRWVYR